MRPVIAVCLFVAMVGAMSGQQPTFRSGVDVIAVDVQVIDREGAPVTSLRPDQFTVTIDGKRRRVASANLVGVDTSPAPDTSAAPAAPRAEGPVETPPGRVYILAFDAASFSALGIEPAREAARQFVSQLRPNDLVGLVVLPYGPNIDVTGNRGQILTALSQIIGHARTVATDRFQLSPSDIADLSRDDFSTCDFAANDPLKCIRDLDPLAADKVVTLCPDPDGNERRFCVRSLLMEAKTTAQFEEADIVERLGGLRSMMSLLGQSAQRKVVVLVSAGMLSTDRSGGRPDVGDVGRLVGQTAAQANASVYTLFVDRERTDQRTAARRGFRAGESSRDSILLSRPLERIAAASGGEFFRVIQGGGDFAFARVLKETSAYYLLGVQPEAQDRDGRPHQLKVTVAQRDTTVRGRSWFALPKPGLRPLAATAAAPVVAPPPKPLPESVRAAAAAYERGEYEAFTRMVAATPNLANAIIDFRTAESPWPSAPRRVQALSLELALAGLASPNGFARDEAVKLLTQAHASVERASDDAFACAWLVAEAAGVEGLWQPNFGLAYVTRAIRRCGSEPRLLLARGVILEQQLGVGSDPATMREIETAYRNAATGGAAFEANVRAAWFAVRHGGAARALPQLTADPPASTDPYLRFVHRLVTGHALRALGRNDEAETAYRQALAQAPSAQSARVSLMTLLLARERRDDAETLAEAVQTTGPNETDPWWTYSRGDARNLAALIANVRELAK